MTRSEAREQAFFVLFEKIFCEDETIEEIVGNAQEAGLIKINNFASVLLEKAGSNGDEIDTIIADNLRGWSIQRLPKVSLAVLRLAVSEIKYVDEVPAGVTVNEAVELMKKYGTTDDASYVNGVLGAIVKGL
ncbi:MAG: transcription antitermination factor NusB [Clostridia bacterium]|nr:transcription antitermination factor NusB [Clostridia bacterium]